MLTSLLLAAQIAATPVHPAPAVTPVPQDQGAHFIGVETCGSSTCHDSPEPWRNATVLMREYRLWRERDPHARSTRTLAGEKAATITRALGLAEPARAPECLACHDGRPALAKNPAQPAQDIACESCHGAGSKFLAAHVSTLSTHANSVARGLYPTTDPGARARLCGSCHEGDGERRMTHRMMAAGHPVLRFELDTWSGQLPYHAQVDADYLRRKPMPSHADLWFAGQVASTRNFLARLEHPSSRSGLFPELSLFDCGACHRPMRVQGAPERFDLGLGRPALRSGTMVLMAAAARASAPELAPRWREAERRLNLAVATNEGIDAAITLSRQLLADTERLWSALPPARRPPPVCLARAMIEEAEAQSPLPRIASEGYTMAIGSLLLAARESGRLPPATHDAARVPLQRLHALLAAPESHDEGGTAAKVQAQLQQLAGLLPTCAANR